MARMGKGPAEPKSKMKKLRPTKSTGLKMVTERPATGGRASAGVVGGYPRKPSGRSKKKGY